jgi:hypothetical protein
MINRFRYVIPAILLLCKVVFSQNEFTLQPGTVVVPVDGDRAKELIMTEDEYTAVFSRFDLQSKSLKAEDAALEDYFKVSTDGVLPWLSEDIENIKKVAEYVNKKIKGLGLKLALPPRIEVIKSNMKSEGGAAGYTRGNYIVLSRSYVGSYSASLRDLFIHELFHILSRNDKITSEKIYNSLGFKMCNEVAYPPEVAERRISNPDAPFNNYYITVDYENKPVEVMLILYSSKSYEGGSFFPYMQVGLLVVEGEEFSKSPVYRDGKPLILQTTDVNNFYEQVGRNTGYILHAEEISADHFVMLLTGEKGLANPELIESMKNVMK